MYSFTVLNNLNNNLVCTNNLKNDKQKACSNAHLCDKKRLDIMNIRFIG